jgi:two-component system, OmpR family, copper resistance phosphate regulon response regulator CusR
MRILVVEDERKLAKALKEGLETDHYSVDIAQTGEEGFYLAETGSFDLVLLDVTLPGRNGIEILSAMRQKGLKTPVLILTARDAVEDRVRGLDAGADDYLIKPFASRNCWLESASCLAAARRTLLHACESRILRWMLWDVW